MESTYSCISWVVLFLLLLLTVLYKISRRVRFFVKLTVIIVLGLWVVWTSTILSLFRPVDARNAMFLSWLGRNVMAKAFGIKCEIKNVHHLLNKHSCVIVANHQSAFDVLGMMFMWPYVTPAVSVMKKQLMYAGPVGLLGYLTSSLFLDRGKSEKARASLNAKIEEVKAKKWKIWVFPEGTRNANHETLLPFKKGAFHIAVKAQIPIIPVVFAPYSHVYDLKARVLEPGTMTAYVLPPVSTEGMSADDIPKLVETVREPMVNCYVQHIKNNKPEMLPCREKNSHNGHIAKDEPNFSNGTLHSSESISENVEKNRHANGVHSSHSQS